MSNRAKPTSIRLLEGNPGHRPIPDTPKYKIADIEPPRGMKKIPKKVWKDIAPLLEPVGILTEVDLPTFYIMCSVYARWRETETLIDKAKKANGGFIDNNVAMLMRLSLNYAKEWRMYADEFGMTPSSRSRVEAKGIKETEADYLD